MQKVQNNDQSLLWPIFGPKKNVVIKRFWDKTKVALTAAPLLAKLMYRIGKKKVKAKAYFFKLDSNYVLSYYKSEKEKIPKGILQLGDETQISLNYLELSKTEKVIAITFQRSEKLKYSFYATTQEGVFDWYDLLVKRCSLSNFEEMYQPLELLGKGSFATVYKVQKLLDDTFFAAKIYYKETFFTNQKKDKFVEMIKYETQILREVEHPGIWKGQGFYYQDLFLIFLTDCFDNGSSKWTRSILADQNKQTASRINCSNIIIQYVHFIIKINKVVEFTIINNLNRAGYVHRDLKLENILLSEKNSYQTKILDFGFAEPINRKELVSKAGTPGYIAPEVFYNKPYTEKGDVFSLGVIFFSMLGGYSPFKGANYKQIMEANKNAEIQLNKSCWEKVSDDCKQVLLRMLQVDPEKRISFEELLNCTWMQNQLSEHKQKQLMSQMGSVNSHMSQNQFDSFDFKQRGEKVRSFFEKSNKSIASRKSGFNQDEQQQQQQQVSEIVDEFSVPTEHVTQMDNVYKLSTNKNHRFQQ